MALQRLGSPFPQITVDETAIIAYIERFIRECGARPSKVTWEEVQESWLGRAVDYRTAVQAIISLKHKGLLEVAYTFEGIIDITLAPICFNRANTEGTIARKDAKQNRSIFVSLTNYGNIANLNLGTVVGDMNAHLHVLEESGKKEVADSFSELASGISKDLNLQEEQKVSLSQQIAWLAEQAGRAHDRQDPTGVRTILNTLRETLSASGSLASLWSLFGPVILRHFGLG